MVDDLKFVLRIPPSLHKKIKRAAKGNNTSMNKQIINDLELKSLDAKKVDAVLKLLRQ